MAALLLLILTIAGLACLAWKGDRPERVAALCVLAYLAAVPLLEPLKVLNWRAGVALAELGLFIAFWTLAERSRRWWLTAAGGFQIISLASFALPWIFGGLFTWTGVMLRNAVWVLILFTLFAGAWEAAADRRYRLEHSS
jgi:hypothetical protein